MKHSFPLLCSAPLLLMCALEGRAQCSAITGVYDGSPVPGNHYTPYASNTGSPNRRGFRAQYIYPATELVSAGLCPGTISCISFFALEDDLLTGPGVDGIPGTADDTPGSELRIDLRLGHSSLNTFGEAVDVSDTATSVLWDAAVVGSINLNAQSVFGTTVHAGWNDYYLLGSGFNWNGVQNLVIDLSWQRNAQDGVSPAVQLEENLPYTATKWVQVTSNFGIDHGNTYSDDALPWGGTTGTTNTRPVTRFNCEASVGLSPREQEFSFTGHWDAAQGAVVLSLPKAEAGRMFQLSDAAGRVLCAVRSRADVMLLTLPVPGATSGVLFVTTEGTVRPLRLMVIR